MEALFCRYFSIQGRSIKHLHASDDIEVFISYVKQITWQLNHKDVVALSLMKACMPEDIYDTLYLVKELDVHIAIVNDFYAKKPELRAATGATISV